MVRATLLLFGCLANLLVAVPSSAQTNAEPASLKYIPPDALALLSVNVKDTIKEESLSMLPFEVAQAFGKQELGFDPLTIERIDVVAGIPLPTGPQIAGIITFSEDVSVEQLNPKAFVIDQPQTMAGLKLYRLNDPRSFVMLHFLDSRHVMVGTPPYVVRLAKTKLDDGDLRNVAKRLSANPGNVSFCVAIEPVRDLLLGVAQNPQIPPMFAQDVQTIAAKTKLIYARLAIGQQANLALAIEAGSDEDLGEVEGSVKRLIETGMQLGLGMAKANLSQVDTATSKAAIAWLDRVAVDYKKQLTPLRSGNRLVLKFDGDQQAVIQSGVMIGLLLPAIQAARQTAGRVNSMNNAKQIGLAFHNYHDAFRRLPPALPGGPDGESKLSWRVHILPFIDQVQLYNQFHMDEPWDSPHNIKLLERMPDVFKEPSSKAAPGYTVYQAPAGKGQAFEPGVKVTFRNFTDGLSNTIFMFETTDEAAVPWTKPDERDPAQDLTILRNNNGSLVVLLGDGSVRRIPATIDAESFKGLLTIGGGEVVDIP